MVLWWRWTFWVVQFLHQFVLFGLKETPTLTQGLEGVGKVTVPICVSRIQQTNQGNMRPFVMRGTNDRELWFGRGPWVLCFIVFGVGKDGIG